MMDVEGDDGRGRGEGDQADGNPVIQSCELNSDFFRMKNKIILFTELHVHVAKCATLGLVLDV